VDRGIIKGESNNRGNNNYIGSYRGSYRGSYSYRGESYKKNKREIWDKEVIDALFNEII